MQAVKNMAGTVKHKVEEAAATADEKKDIVKAEVEEKVEKLRANDDESKEEASRKKTEKGEIAEDTKDRKIHHERQDPVSHSPTPADLDMPAENPSQPTMNSGSSAIGFPQSIPAPIVPLTGAFLSRK